MEREYLSLDTAKKLHKEKDNKIDKNILEANIKLVDENKQLQQENKQLQQQCKKQQEVIDNINLIIKGLAYGGNEDYYMENFSKINELLKEVSY